MVPFVRLWLISVLVAACRAFPSWYDCNPQNCQGPDCVCASLAPPGGLTPAETPQIITITHDDAVNPLSNKVVKAVIDKHTNPNGCNVPATWFTLQKVRLRCATRPAIGSNSPNHQLTKSPTHQLTNLRLPGLRLRDHQKPLQRKLGDCHPYRVPHALGSQLRGR